MHPTLNIYYSPLCDISPVHHATLSAQRPFIFGTTGCSDSGVRAPRSDQSVGSRPARGCGTCIGCPPLGQPRSVLTHLLSRASTTLRSRTERVPLEDVLGIVYTES